MLAMLLCLMGWRGGAPSSHDGGGIPHPVMMGGGYPIPGLDVWGVPQVPPHHPDLAREGYPVMVGGTPSQVWVGGTPSHPRCRWWGVPHHHPDLAGGTPTTFQTWPGGTLGTPPTSRSWMGYLYPDLGWEPPDHTWDGVPPHPYLGWDTPLTWDGVPPTQTWNGVPPTTQT